MAANWITAAQFLHGTGPEHELQPTHSAKTDEEKDAEETFERRPGNAIHGIVTLNREIWSKRAKSSPDKLEDEGSYG